MSDDLLITPGSRKLEIKDTSGNIDAKIETDSSGNLVITNPGGDISIGDTTADVFIGDGTNNIDIVFEQDGEIRGTSGVTVTLGASGSNVRMATDLNLNSNDLTNVATITTTGNATVGGNLAVTGDLNITGNVNSASVTDLDVTDKTITLGVGQNEASSGGSGIVIAGSLAELKWNESNDRFEMNKGLSVSSIVGNGAGLSNLDAGQLTSGTIPSARLNQPTSGNWWSGGATVVQTDGVMEIGKYIDFHNTDTATSDFDVRLQVHSTNNLSISGNGRILTTADEGSGNGLDADTLDGQHGSHYLDRANHTGTLSLGTVGTFNIEGGSADYNTSTPGTTQGSLHFDPGTTSNNFGNAITFGASDTSNGETAQAGIYIRSDGNYGTKMYIATTDSYASGSKTSLLLNSNGDVSIHRGDFQIQGVDVITSARNLTNIGTIGSGAITATGIIKAQATTGNNRGVSLSLNGEIEQTSSIADWLHLQRYHEGRVAIGNDGNSFLYVKNYIDVVDGYRLNNTEIVDSSRNLTNIGTISSGGITAPFIDARAASSTTTNTTSYFSTSVGATGAGDDWQNSPISVRERGLVGVAQSGGQYNPNINFHWASRVSMSLSMDLNGDFHFGSYDTNGVPTYTTVASMSHVNARGYKVGNTIVINDSRNLANIGVATVQAINVEQTSPSIKLKDTANGGGGGARGILTFGNTGGEAMGLGYTDNVTSDSDFIISSNAGGTYGGYLGLDANAITDAQSDIILEPKTNVRIATGSIEMGTTPFIDQSRNITAVTGAFSSKVAVMSSSVHGSFDFYNNGTSYFNAGVTVDDSLNLTGANRALKVDGVTVIDSNREGKFSGGLVTSSTRADTGYCHPVGHYTTGEEVFSIDPTWTSDQLAEFFDATTTEVDWYADSTAPDGYAIRIQGSVSVGPNYGSGFPYISAGDIGDEFYMECYIRNEDSNQTHYMGGIEKDESFGAPDSGSGNPGSFGYWVMLNQNPGTSWTKVSGYIKNTGGSNSTGEFETGANYFVPMALFNYTSGAGTRTCYISGWKCFKVTRPGGIHVKTAADARPAIIAENTGGIDGIIQEWIGDSDKMQMTNISGGDYTLKNNQQSNGISFFDGTGGVGINYNNAEVVKVGSAGGLVLNSGSLQIPNQLIHKDDSDTYIKFDTDRVRIVDGGGTYLDTNNGTAVLHTSTSFGGDVSGSYDAIVVADDSHNHVISNVDGLQTALDGKLTSSSNLNANNLSSGTIPTARLPNPISISGGNAIIKLQETDVTNNPQWWIVADGGTFSIRLNNTGSYPISIATNASNNAVSQINIDYNTIFGGTISSGAITSSGIIEAAGALRVTETGTVQSILIGNQDSAGVNKPGMIQGVNGYLRFGHGDSWSGEGGTFTEVFTTSGNDVNVGDGSADSRILIKKADNNVSDHIQFYNGTTRTGEIGSQDNTWLRINQVTNKNIYTPRYIRADNGFFVDGTSIGIDGSGNLIGIGTVACGAITSGGNSVLTGSGSSGNAFTVKRGVDSGNALRIQNAGEVVVENNYLYAARGSGVGFYVQSGAVFRGNISNDTGTHVTIADDVRINGVINQNGKDIITSSGTTLTIGDVTDNDEFDSVTIKAMSGTSQINVGDSEMILTGDVFITENLRHSGDANTRIQFTGDRIRMYSGNLEMLDLVEGTTDYVDIIDRVRVTAGGDMICEGDVVAFTSTSVSDIKQKENIEVIADPLEKVLKLKGVTFDWKKDKTTSAGIIAQDVEKVLPEIVKQKEDRSGEEFKSVDYNGVIGLLVEGMKEQQKLINRLEERIKDLENKGE